MAGLNNIKNKTSENALKLLKKSCFISNEQWKYTRLSQFDKHKLYDKKINLKQYNNKHNEHITVYNNNQIFYEKNNKYLIDTIDNAIKSNLPNCNKIFNKIIPENQNKYILSNTAYFNKGFYIHIKDNAILKNPIVINIISDSNKAKTFLNFRYLISIGKNSSVKIILKNSHKKELSINSVFEIMSDENSNTDLIMESSRPKTTEICNFSSLIKNNATLNIFPFDITGNKIKNNFFIELKEQNSSFNYNSINLLNDKNHIDNYIEINHNSKYTYSNTNQKNILSGVSTSIFYSKAIIKKNSSNSEAYQSNKNMMLSKKANVHSNPQLEIHNNDVKCAHGSTTGEINPDSIFYLRSRGIKLEDAKKMLLTGFLNETIDSININFFKKNINKKFNRWIIDVN